MALYMLNYIEHKSFAITVESEAVACCMADQTYKLQDQQDLKRDLLSECRHY